MASLKVYQFACIEEAEVELGNLTILIGPQASGKSVICKLIYFFYELMIKDLFSSEEDRDWKGFSTYVVTEFKQWFPIVAWGRKKFSIIFEAGPIALTISRTTVANKPGQNVKFLATEYFMKQFENFAELVAAQKSKMTASQRLQYTYYNALLRIETNARRKLRADLKSHYIEGQTFIPAGRSFFTSIGKAIAAFEQGGMLDPVTVAFGRLFARLRDRDAVPIGPFMPPHSRDSQYRQALMQQFFGGDIKLDRDKQFIESKDGRRIPFSLLSSGQQELLPLWMVLNFVTNFGPSSKLIFIEEPEAHLFPTSQNQLVEYLASLLTRTSGNHLIITTHSPYVLAKINNLLKAGSLGQKLPKEQRSKLNEVVPEASWLLPENTKAYAVKDGRLLSIVDADAMIDGEYLDSVSNEVGREFSKLLSLEFNYEKT